RAPHAAHAGVAPLVGVELLHDRDQVGVVGCPLRRGSCPPGVVTGRGHAQLAAHEVDRVLLGGSPVRDRSELHCFPLANQVATFFANSTCICNSAIVALSSLDSTRSRISSARSDSSNGASAGTCSARASLAFFTHFPNVIS